MYTKPSVKRVGSFSELTLWSGYASAGDVLYAGDDQVEAGFSADICITPGNPTGIEC